MSVNLRVAYLLLCVSVSGPALATDKIEFGPSPAWVKTVAPPTALPVGGSLAGKSLIEDRQFRAEPGKLMVHSVSAVQFLTPEGLQGGNVSVEWRPDKDRVEVNRLVIIRAGKTIDLLAAGQRFTILQREQNLDMAMFDGRLTAALQPEGLQVGDILLFEMTITSIDPALGEHVEFIAALANDSSAQRIELHAEWPSSLGMSQRSYDMPVADTRTRDGTTSFKWTFVDPAPFVTPKGAPVRFQIGRRAEFTDFKNWDQLSALMRPLFDRAATIPATGPLRDEVEKIRSTAKTPAARAEAALILVEDRVRYVALLMGAGDYTPASAETTWSRRFGDCKAKTALLVAILRELGVVAVPLLVSSTSGDGLDQRLPLLAAFDHVLVRATIDQRDYFLDATRSGDTRIDRLLIPYYHWGLPLTANAQLVPMMPSPLLRPQTDTIIHLDASGGGDKPAPAHVERIFRGDLGIVFNMLFAKVPQAARDKALRDYWKREYSDLTVTTTSATFDRSEGEYHLVADGTMKLTLYAGRYSIDVPAPGYKPDFKRDAGLHVDAPLWLNYPDYTRTVETIVVPDQLIGFGLDDAEPIDRIVAGVRYRRTLIKKGNLFTAEGSSQTLVPEIPFAQAIAAEADLRSLDKKDYKVNIANPSKAENDKIIARVPTSASNHYMRGQSLILNERYDEGIAELDQAAALDPKMVRAFETRGFAKLRKDDLAGAKLDFQLATTLGSKMPSLELVQAAAASKAKNWAQAIQHLDLALKILPESIHLLMMRAEANRLNGDFAAAIDDSNRVTGLSPANGQAYLFRINLFQRRGRKAEANAQADALMKLKLSDPFGYVAAANTYATNGRMADAMRAFDRAIATSDEGYIYLNRAKVRPKSDKAGRLADIRQAVKLDTDNPDVLAALGEELGEGGDWKGAVVEYGKAIAAEPNSTTLRVARGLAYLHIAQQARAEADFAFVRAEAETNALALNQMCWDKGVANLALDSALGDCDRALAIEPTNGAYLDSRAFVLLRLGRLDESIATYDRALKDGPKGASLYGRALAWARKGDRAKSKADAAAAVKLWSGIAEQFAGYGLKLDAK